MKVLENQELINYAKATSPGGVQEFSPLQSTSNKETRSKVSGAGSDSITSYGKEVHPLLS